MNGAAPTLLSTITCPDCRAVSHETMPTDACTWFWECPACGRLQRPKPGDCCVFCSYGDVPCPPKQAGDACCGPAQSPSSTIRR